MAPGAKPRRGPAARSPAGPSSPAATQPAPGYGRVLTCLRVRPALTDEEGIAVIPLLEAEQLYMIATHRAKKDSATNIDEWEAIHHAKIKQLLLK